MPAKRMSWSNERRLKLPCPTSRCARSTRADAETLAKAGVSRVYTPKDFDLTRIMDEIVDVVAESNAD